MRAATSCSSPIRSFPWIGVTAVGFALGRSTVGTATAGSVSAATRPGAYRSVLPSAPSTCTAIRSSWATQAAAGFTPLSFLNTTKYPPSLLFLLMTLGSRC